MAHTVICMLEAKSGKEQALQTAVEGVMNTSRAEPACQVYELHRHNTNPQQFILYEVWDSEALHQQQFTKPYIIAFAEQLDELLAVPYQATVATRLSA